MNGLQINSVPRDGCGSDASLSLTITSLTYFQVDDPRINALLYDQAGGKGIKLDIALRDENGNTVVEHEEIPFKISILHGRRTRRSPATTRPWLSYNHKEAKITKDTGTRTIWCDFGYALRDVVLLVSAADAASTSPIRNNCTCGLLKVMSKNNYKHAYETKITFDNDGPHYQTADKPVIVESHTPRSSIGSSMSGTPGSFTPQNIFGRDTTSPNSAAAGNTPVADTFTRSDMLYHLRSLQHILKLYDVESKLQIVSGDEKISLDALTHSVDAMIPILTRPRIAAEEVNNDVSVAAEALDRLTTEDFEFIGLMAEESPVQGVAEVGIASEAVSCNLNDGGLDPLVSRILEEDK